MGLLSTKGTMPLATEMLEVEWQLWGSGNDSLGAVKCDVD